MDHSLKLDINGACYVVYPDCPVFRAPDATPLSIGAMVGFGQHIAGPLNIEDFSFKHVTIFAVMLMLLAYFLIPMVFGIFF